MHRKNGSTLIQKVQKSTLRSRFTMTWGASRSLCKNPCFRRRLRVDGCSKYVRRTCFRQWWQAYGSNKGEREWVEAKSTHLICSFLKLQLWNFWENHVWVKPQIKAHQMKCLHSPEWSEAKDDSGKIRIECTFSAPELLLQKTFVAWHESPNICSKERYRTVLQAATVAWLNSRAEATETECERARTDRSIARVFARRCLLLARGDALIFGLLSWVAHGCHRQW